MFTMCFPDFYKSLELAPQAAQVCPWLVSLGVKWTENPRSQVETENQIQIVPQHNSNRGSRDGRRGKMPLRQTDHPFGIVKTLFENYSCATEVVL